MLIINTMQNSSYDKNKTSQEKRLRVQLTVNPTRPPEQGNSTNCKNWLSFNQRLRLQLNLGLELDLELCFA
jgi:hypothetical protein